MSIHCQKCGAVVYEEDRGLCSICDHNKINGPSDDEWDDGPDFSVATPDDATPHEEGWEP